MEKKKKKKEEIGKSGTSSRIFNNVFSGPNLELRLIRKMNRWDLRNPEVYSCATVYDVTLFTKSSIAQNVHFQLRDEFQGKL